MGSSISLALAGAAMLGFAAEDHGVLLATSASFDDVSATEQGQMCSKGNIAVASISITGRKHDSFTLKLTCGGVEVTSCTATVKSGDMGQCSSQAAAPNDKEMKCAVTPGTNNSPSARVFARSCY